MDRGYLGFPPFFAFRTLFQNPAERLARMCGRPLGCKSFEENSSDGRVDCEHVSDLSTRHHVPLAQMGSAIQPQKIWRLRKPALVTVELRLIGIGHVQLGVADLRRPTQILGNRRAAHTNRLRDRPTLAPQACLSRNTSRTFRIDNLSPSIASPSRDEQYATGSLDRRLRPRSPLQGCPGSIGITVRNPSEYRAIPSPHFSHYL